MTMRGASWACAIRRRQRHASRRWRSNRLPSARPRGSGDPEPKARRFWIPAFAGMNGASTMQVAHADDSKQISSVRTGKERQFKNLLNGDDTALDNFRL